MKLYGFSRSSAAFRVRIALNLKGVEWEHINISLPDGDQFGDDYKRLNPQARVPTLINEETVLYQSMAILEYLDETQPDPAFLPAAPAARASGGPGGGGHRRPRKTRRTRTRATAAP